MVIDEQFLLGIEIGSRNQKLCSIRFTHSPPLPTKTPFMNESINEYVSCGSQLMPLIYLSSDSRNFFRCLVHMLVFYELIGK